MKEASVKLLQKRIRLEVTAADLSDLDLKAQRGELLVEFGVPGLFSQQSPSQHAVRQAMVMPQNVCARITDLRLDDNDMLYGTIVPEGPKSKLVKQSIAKGTVDQLEFDGRYIDEGGRFKLVGFDLTGFKVGNS